MKKPLLTVFIAFFLLNGFAQQTDSTVIKHMYDEALRSKISYQNLEFLCKRIGGRVTGSPQAAAAVEFTKQVMDNMGLDTVILQEVTVPVWSRGSKEYASITSTIMGFRELNVTALGTSIGTGPDGMHSEIIAVKNFKQLDSLANLKSPNSKLPAQNLIKGKIVFFDRPADPTQFNTFDAYGGAVDQRAVGAVRAAKCGAIGIIIRSTNVGDENNPHTGVMHYDPAVTKIPAIAVSNKHADLIDQWLKVDPKLILYFKTDCKQLKDSKSNNVIGEIRGSEHPDEIITVGGHLDSWDTGEGAHDDGTGCIQSIEVLRLFKALNIKPKHTIRAVMFIDEEIAQSGGKAYLANAKKNKEKHIAGMESDAGGTTPIGLSIDASPEVVNKIKTWAKQFDTYGLYRFVKGGSGTDIGPLKELGIPLFGLLIDSQSYFDHHHSYNDRFETVDRRQMQLGSATMASFIYLIDKYGL